MAEKRTKSQVGRLDEQANTAWWRASAEQATARRALLQARWVAFDALEGAWLAVVGLVERLTEPWPAAFAEVTAAEPSAVALMWRDEPGSAHPFIRPALEELGAALEGSREQWELDELLAEPPEPTLPAPPKTTAGARRQYREASARAKRLAVALARSHVRREAAQDAVSVAIVGWQVHWLAAWSRRVGDAAGSRERGLALAETMRAEGLENLRSALDRLRPRPRMTAPARRQRKGGKTMRKTKAAKATIGKMLERVRKGWAPPEPAKGKGKRATRKGGATRRRRA